MFEIQHRDALTNKWKTVGVIEGNGQEAAETAYNCLDRAFGEKRLKYTKEDTSATYPV